MESFSQYHPIFAEAINSNRIGVCKWIESGTTIDTALPELCDLIDDKKGWRAVIVRYIDDDCMAAFESNPRNPYDFLLNKDSADAIEESPIPLVRLTQMLGGVPPLEMKFELEVIREEHKAPRTVYVPVKDEPREKKHRELAEKYEFDGKPPCSIIIISIRNRKRSENDIGDAWLSHKESKSSEFWKRNHFPSICRFMVYDFERNGAMQKEADSFGFWYSVMLMAINECDPSTMQAYRVYSLGISMDGDAMAESFQALADKLRDAKHSIEKSIKKDIENQVCAEEALPDYRLDIPVALKLPQEIKSNADGKIFSLLSGGAASDIAIWSRHRRALEDALTVSIRSAERTLDQAADKMRINCTVTEDEVVPLNRYQVEDLVRETGEIYQQIIRIQGEMPKNNITKDEEAQQAAEAVKKNLAGRVVKKPALISLIIVALLILLAAAPAFAYSFTENMGSLPVLVYVVAGCILLVILCALCVLIIQKIKLNILIGRYDLHIKNAFNKLVKNADAYSDYMSGIASHSRGSSYLNISERKKFFSDLEHSSKYKHLKAINILLGKLKTWSKAYHLEVDFSSKRPESRADVDTSTMPSENKLYVFETKTSYPVAINNSGMSISSPYAFAGKIRIVREELYEDE